MSCPEPDGKEAIMECEICKSVEFFRAAPHNGARRFGQCFDTSESMENAGILDVFPIFHTARLGQKIRRSPLSPPSGVAFVYPESMKSRGIPDVFPDFHTAPGKQKISFSAADDLFRGSLGFLPVYHKRRLFAIYSPSLRIPNSPSLRASSLSWRGNLHL